MPASCSDPLNASHVVDTLRSRQAFLAQSGVLHADIFGSVARGEAGSESDVDILLTFGGAHEKRGFARVAALEDVREALRQALNRRVDVTSATAVDPAIRQRIALEAIRAF